MTGMEQAERKSLSPLALPANSKISWGDGLQKIGRKSQHLSVSGACALASEKLPAMTVPENSGANLRITQHFARAMAIEKD